MTNNIKHVLFTSYGEMLDDVSPVADLDAVKGKLKVDVSDLFSSQRVTDKAKSCLGKAFPQAVRLYLSGFLIKDRVDFRRLRTSLEAHESNFLRHLGKEKVAFLKLLIQISEASEERRKGLLFEAVS